MTTKGKKENIETKEDKTKRKEGRTEKIEDVRGLMEGGEIPKAIEKALEFRLTRKEVKSFKPKVVEWVVGLAKEGKIDEALNVPLFS
jgi:hypothetical protein